MTFAGARSGAEPGECPNSARNDSGRVVATDILPMDGIDGVDIVLSNMAPNMSGVDAVDQPRAMYLAELALDMATRVLKREGSALIKVFQGAGFQEFVATARRSFAKVKLQKPEASRARSPELYLLAKHFLMV